MSEKNLTLEEKETINKNTKKASKDLFLEYMPYLIIIFFVVIIRLFVATPVNVKGSSMSPTLQNGDTMILYKLTKNIRGIKRFDIVVIKMDKELLIKRVIGLPNEEVKYVDNKLYINNEYVEETFLNEDVYTTNFSLSDINLEKIPENCYLVMGDNREVSLDSRTFGCFSKDKILGSANLVLFPFTKLGYKK